MLGRFHEISLSCSDPAAALARFESLGFRELAVGEIWTHPYAVVSDGRLNIGLHGLAFDAPRLTFVQSNLGTWAQAYRSEEIELTSARLGDEEFNEIRFVDPGEQPVWILESRTYSPPPFDEIDGFPLGRFSCVELPHVAWPLRCDFWRKLGAEVSGEHIAAPGLKIEHGDGPLLRCVYQGDVLEAARHAFAAGIDSARVAADDSFMHFTPVTGLEIQVRR